MMIPEQVRKADVVFVNHSGGKDSQAMLSYIHRQGFRGEIVIIHADLGEMEWEPMHPFIERNSFGYPVHIIKPPMSFFELCERYNRIPGGMSRFCTSDLKTQPLGRFMKQYCREKGHKLAINAMGIRAQESTQRSRKEPFKLGGNTLVREGIEFWDWYPIFDYSISDVFDEIRHAGQTPHPVYSQGFSRLSCVFCVFGKIHEHEAAAKLKPELFRKMASLERRLGKTIRTRQVNGEKLPKYMDEYLTT